MKLKEFLQWGEHAVNDVLNSLNDVSLNLASKLGPWFAPAIPAYFIAKSLYKNLHVDFSVALIAAGSVEFIGILVISVHQNATNWNIISRDRDPKVDTKITLNNVRIYLTVALILSVGLELIPILSPLAIGAFVVLTSISSNTLTILNNLTRWQDEIGEELRLSKAKAKILANIKEFTQKLKTLTSEFSKLGTEVEDAKNSLKTVIDEVKVAKVSLQVLQEEKATLQGEINQLSKGTNVVKPKLKTKASKVKSINKKQDIADRQAQVKLLFEQGLDKHQIAAKLPGKVSHGTIYNDLKFLATSEQSNGKVQEIT